MQQPSDTLIAELRAIELWDRMFREADKADEVDTVAWIERRKRRFAIYEEIGVASSLSSPN